MVEDAVAAGVTGMITMGGDNIRNQRAVELAHTLPRVWAGVGWDPQSQIDEFHIWKAQLQDDPRIVVIGEVGLDYDNGGFGPDGQLAVFKSWCRMATEVGLPVSIHNRGGTDDIIETVKEFPGLRGVMHYFADGWEVAQRFLQLGLHLSFSGLVTRPSRHELREVVKRCPADRLLLETDSPYGNAHKRMGVPNRPAYLLDTAEVVADLRGLSLDALGELETANAFRLFTRMK